MATRSSTSDVLTLASAIAATGVQPKKFWADQFGHIQSFANWSVQCTVSTGTFTVQIQGSLDGVNWFSVGSSISTAGISAVTIGANVAVPYVRANISALAGGAVLTVLVVGVN